MYLYCISSETTLLHGQRKLGYTKYPIHRMRVYNTGDAPFPGNEKQYEGLWRVDSKSRETLLHSHFHSQRLKRKNGNYSEWFTVSLEEVGSFLRSQDYVVEELAIEQIQEIHRKADSPVISSDIIEMQEELALLIGDSEQLVENIEIEITTPPLKSKFFDTFLPGKVPRRIQSELWDRFEALCLDDESFGDIYKGIVQWPTGTGKTIAILLLVVIAKERCRRLGRIYRGIIVTGKTDIFKTIIQHFKKLELFGITLLDCTDKSPLSKMVSNIPVDRDILIFACHQSITNTETVESLPDISHIHYDEVHRVTGDVFFHILLQKLSDWKTTTLTGTSATPKTSSPSQHKKLAELFGDPYTVLHRCDVEEAVQEGWIARPRFIVKILPKLEDNAAILESFVDCCVSTFLQKKKDGKAIFYIETSMEDVLYAYSYAKRKYPTINFYNAVDGYRTDSLFLEAPISSTPEILFACQRYREGSDIHGLEVTGKLMGNVTSAYILLQICGRSLRMEDDPNKEGWCMIARACEQGTTEESVLDSVVLEIAELLGNAEKSLKQKEIEMIVRTYFGPVSISGKDLTIDETVARIQASYNRIQCAKRTPKERYEVIRTLNKELGLRSKDDYITRASGHKLPEDPKAYFKDWWVSWYHFLGVDTSFFPQTKLEWTRVCKELGFWKKSWTDAKYLEKRGINMPEDPKQMYEEYDNWDKEMEVEEEIFW